MFKKKREFDTIKNNYQFYFVFFTILFTCLIFFIISFQDRNEFKTRLILTHNKNQNIFLTILNLIFDNKNDKLSETDHIGKLNNKKIIDLKQFKDLNILAKSYIVYDVSNENIIVMKNGSEILPLASLTKVASALTILRLASSTNDIIIKEKLMNKDQNLDLGLKENQKWRMGELLKFALTYSSNSAIDIIVNTISNTKSSHEFVDLMNSYIQSLGFQDLVFTNASGLDYDDKIGGKGTVLTYAKFFAKSYILMPEILSYTTNSKINIESKEEKIYSIPNTK